MKRILATSFATCFMSALVLAPVAEAALINVANDPGNSLASSGNFSTSTSYVNSNAIDGDTETFYLSNNISDPWWKVDFEGDEYTVEQVIIWNRNLESVSNRFHNVFVQLRDDANNVLWESDKINPWDFVGTAPTPDADPGTAGNQFAGPFIVNIPDGFVDENKIDNVIIRRDGTTGSGAVGFAEVQVMVQEVPEPSSLVLLFIGVGAVVLSLKKK